MKKPGIFVVLNILLSALLCAFSVNFDDYFIDRTMRIDYFHTGDAKEDLIAIDLIYQQGIWAGSKHNLIDTFDNGRYSIKVYDFASKKLIFSKGFDSYFGEYKTTDLALRGMKRTYHESALIPYPKEKVLFTIEARNRENLLQPLFSQDIDPHGMAIVKESLKGGVQVLKVVENGDSHQKVDLAFIGEGYTLQEWKKFKSDVERCAKILFTQEPYKTCKDRFNVYGVLKPSQESGCDEPSHGVFKNTPLNASFDALGSERYLLTEDNRSLRDIAAHVPYDALLIMVNHTRYGGGGIYNLYCTFTVDSDWHEYLMIHEFGHSFAGLADEYYTSSVAYNEFYPRGVEPREPNITALLDRENLKWKDLATAGIEIPTPWEKESFDKMDTAYQQLRGEVNEKIARLKREGAPEKKVKEAEKESALLSWKHTKSVAEFLRKSKLWGMVGAFEGAGYSAKDLYRPMVDCIMFTKSANEYCKVCERAVNRMIHFFTSGKEQ